MTERNPWPTEIRLAKTKDALALTFDDGQSFSLRAEYLRVESPSAEVQGHGTGQKKIVLGKEAVKISALEPVGNYALRIIFDDGHDSGLYTWAYLRKLAEEQGEIWATYQERATTLKMQSQA
ncbi:MAG: DUF971 domain-containing protein [Alphaproteobacteria bacterium]|nr:MAG: DUF971 domain-containing protein [Alphaproteobacteria bacterium]